MNLLLPVDVVVITTQRAMLNDAAYRIGSGSEINFIGHALEKVSRLTLNVQGSGTLFKDSTHDRLL